MQNVINKFTEELKSSGKSIHTIIAYKKDIEQLLEYFSQNGVKDFSDVTEEKLRDYFKSTSQNNSLSIKTVSRKLNSTRTFFKYLENSNIIKENPASSISHPKIESNTPRILSEIEYRALRDTARSDTRTFIIIELLLQTGIRIGELCRIIVEDIHLDPKNPTLKITAYASNPERVIPLNQSAVKVLQQYLEIRPKNAKTEELFITKNGNPLLVRNVRSTIDNMFRKSGIEKAKVNDLRNTFIAHHLSKGTNIFQLSKIIGHKRISTTEKYIGKIKMGAEKLMPLAEL